MTDCGLVPALLSVIEMDSASCETYEGHPSSSRINALRTFITSQAVQILESSIVNHSNAMSAFNDLNGSDLIVSRLSKEVKRIKERGGSAGAASRRPISAPLHVLLVSVINNLTVMYHSHASNQNSNMSVDGSNASLISVVEDILSNTSEYGGTLTSLTCTLLSDLINSDPQSVKDVHTSGLADCFFDILKEDRVAPLPELVMAIPNVVSALSLTDYGSARVLDVNPFPLMIRLFHSPAYVMPKSKSLVGDMAAIFGTGLDEIIRHVPKLKTACLDALIEGLKKVRQIGKELRERESSCMGRFSLEDQENRTAFLQYVSHMSQLLEQVLMKPEHAGPFIKNGGVELLLSFYEYLLPTDRVLLSHLSSLSNFSMAHLAHFGAASCLTMTIKSVAQFESQTVISLIVKELKTRFEALAKAARLVRGVANDNDDDDKIGTSGGKANLRRGGSGSSSSSSSSNSSSSSSSSSSDTFDVNAEGILAEIPRVPLHMINREEPFDRLSNFSQYLCCIAVVEWLSSVMGTVVRNVALKSESSARYTNERWWRELTSSDFNLVFKKLSALHRSTQLETCRVRTEENYSSREEERVKRMDEVGETHHPSTYVVRIVNPEGAVIRDGIEIDFCNNVGSYDMGTIVVTNDRCINSSGIMRYKGPLGWISECTRGQGREPICEVIEVLRSQEKLDLGDEVLSCPQGTSGSAKNERKGTECGVCDLATVGSHVLSRLQTTFKAILVTLSRAVTGGLSGRSISVSMTFESWAGQVTHSVAVALEKSLSAGLEQVKGRFGENDKSYFGENAVGTKGFLKWKKASCSVSQSSGRTRRTRTDSICTNLGGRLSMGGSAMYLGSVLELISGCVFDEKKSRNINLLLLGCLVGHKLDLDSRKSDNVLGDCINFILLYGMNDMCFWAENERKVFENALKSLAESGFDAKNPPVVLATGDSKYKRVGRTVLSSFIPALVLLKKIYDRPKLLVCPMFSTLKKWETSKSNEGRHILNAVGITLDKGADRYHTGGTFNIERFLGLLHSKLGNMMLTVWRDDRMCGIPPHVANVLLEVIGSCVECCFSTLKAKGDKNEDAGESSSGSGSGSGSTALDMLTSRIGNLPNPPRFSPLSNFPGGPSGRGGTSEVLQRLFGRALLGGSGGNFSATRAAQLWHRAEEAVAESLNEVEAAAGAHVDRSTSSSSNRNEGNSSTMTNAATDTATDAATSTAATSTTATSTAATSNAAADTAPTRAPFVPSEDIITQLGEMGFDREHVLEALMQTETNVAEVAIDYVMNHPAPSPLVVAERVEARRAALARRNEARAGAGTSAAAAMNDGEVSTRETGTTDMSVDVADVSPLLPTPQKVMEQQQKEKDLATLKKFEKEFSQEKENNEVEELYKLINAFDGTITERCLKLIESGSYGVSRDFDAQNRVDDGFGTGDGTAEAMTAIVCNFVVDYEKKTKYRLLKLKSSHKDVGFATPSNAVNPVGPCKSFIDGLIEKVHRLVLLLQGKGKGRSAGKLQPGDAGKLNSLCHALVIMARAYPDVKKAVLKQGLVGLCLSCISRFRSGKIESGGVSGGGVGGWPVWYVLFLVVR